MPFASGRSIVRASAKHCALAVVLLLIGLLPVRHAAAADITGPYARQVQQMYMACYGPPGSPSVYGIAEPTRPLPATKPAAHMSLWDLMCMPSNAAHFPTKCST